MDLLPDHPFTATPIDIDSDHDGREPSGGGHHRRRAGNTSWMIDLGGGQALVVDPGDPAPYLRVAERTGTEIALAAETLHADFVTGMHDLATTGTDIVASAGASGRGPIERCARVTSSTSGAFASRPWRHRATPPSTSRTSCRTVTDPGPCSPVDRCSSGRWPAPISSTPTTPRPSHGHCGDRSATSCWHCPTRSPCSRPTGPGRSARHPATRRWTTIGDERRTTCSAHPTRTPSCARCSTASARTRRTSIVCGR